MTVKERHYWKFIKQILFLLNYILFIIKICQMCKIKSHWMFSVVFFMFYICVICDCVCVLKYAIYLIWPRQFSFGPDSSHLAHVFLIWLIPWPEQKMSQRGPCLLKRCTISLNFLRLLHDCRIANCQQKQSGSQGKLLKMRFFRPIKNHFTKLVLTGWDW